MFFFFHLTAHYLMYLQPGCKLTVNEKLKELADTLEVVPLLKSIEGEANAPFTLLQRWRAGVDSGLEAHSLLVHHLRCIGLIRTADR